MSAEWNLDATWEFIEDVFGPEPAMVCLEKDGSAPRAWNRGIHKANDRVSLAAGICAVLGETPIRMGVAAWEMKDHGYAPAHARCVWIKSETGDPSALPATTVAPSIVIGTFHGRPTYIGWFLTDSIQRPKYDALANALAQDAGHGFVAVGLHKFVLLPGTFDPRPPAHLVLRTGGSHVRHDPTALLEALGDGEGADRSPHRSPLWPDSRCFS